MRLPKKPEGAYITDELYDNLYKFWGDNIDLELADNFSKMVSGQTPDDVLDGCGGAIKALTNLQEKVHDVLSYVRQQILLQREEEKNGKG